MKFPLPNFLSKSTTNDIETLAVSPSLWPWPYYCSQPRTLSFRSLAGDTRRFFRTTNTANSDDDEDLETVADSTIPDEVDEDDDSAIIEMAVLGLRSSERLFFEPGETSSILEVSKKDCEVPSIKESLVMSMESRDPYLDFRKSMEEMVRAYGLKDWDGLKDLLDWYLRVNGKANHGHILAAFVDLLVDIQARVAISHPSTSTAHQFSHHHHHDYTSSPMSSSSPLSLYTCASSRSSSLSLSTPSGGGDCNCSSSNPSSLSCGIAEEFEIR
ncbi:hypothetical protein SAY87_018711 [Trapa incisa]|uniref:Transcription repressor n=1 Tax=Trapa incisa TaxID=236973 RepID=A0AAN7JYL9_9MYRT|nr:hypothetical protein SAY87_018711 [Trapa incisa]